MLTWLEYKKIRRVHFGELRVEARKNYNKYLKEKMKKSIWPYTEVYKGNEMRVFADGSVDVVAHDLCCGDLTEAFKYIDNLGKEKMNSYKDGICVYEEFSLAPCPTPDCPKVSVQKGNNPMYVDNDKHIESSKINYLFDRASCIFFQKASKLPNQFGFGPYDAPESVEEMVARFTAGKFTYKDDTKKNVKGFYYRLLEGITWKDPSVKEDQSGLDVARATLDVLYQDTKDIVAIGTPAEGLAAVKALDAWTPTVTAS